MDKLLTALNNRYAEDLGEGHLSHGRIVYEGNPMLGISEGAVWQDDAGGLYVLSEGFTTKVPPLSFDDTVKAVYELLMGP